MKIRTDFVTNSSSSSFILGFKDESDIEKVRQYFPSYWRKDVIDYVINDIISGKETKENVLKYFEEFIDMYGVTFEGKDLWKYSYADKQNPETPVGKFIKEHKQNISANFAKSLDKYNMFSIVEYEDHTDTGSQLEHEIMLNLSCTIQRISNH